MSKENTHPRGTTGVAADLYSAEFLQDPYPTLAELRRCAPVWWSSRVDGWVLTRYDDCVAVLNDSEHFADTADDGSLSRGIDQAHHVHLRNLVSRALGPDFLAALEPKVQQLLEELLQPVVARGEADFMAAIAYPLPTLVLAEMLGVPPADRAMFMGWASAYTEALAGAPTQTRYRDATGELVAYFGFQLALQPRGDHLLARLAASSLGKAEILSFCNQLMVAARDLTTGLLGNGLHALLSHLDQLQRVRAEPKLLDQAIEECLRWDAPVLGQARIARQVARVGSVEIPPGSRVLVMLAAANRDPDIFRQPDQFDIDRPNAGQHLAFGRGLHFCLGAPVARLEARVVLRTLFEQFPDLRLVAGSAPTRRGGGRMLNLRSFQRLPIRF